MRSINKQSRVDSVDGDAIKDLTFTNEKNGKEESLTGFRTGGTTTTARGEKEYVIVMDFYPGEAIFTFIAGKPVVRETPLETWGGGQVSGQAAGDLVAGEARPWWRETNVEGQNVISEMTGFGDAHRSHRLPGDLVKTIMIDVVGQLVVLHGGGFAHRDIKPENLNIEIDYKISNIKDTEDDETDTYLTDWGMRTEQSEEIRKNEVGFTKLIDWDWVESYEGITTAKATALYAAPEIIDAPVTPYDGKPADMFAIGVVMYVMVNGCYPWTEKKRRGVGGIQSCRRKAIIDSEEEFRKEHKEDVPDWLRRLISNLLEKEPTDRWSAEEVLGILKRDEWPVEKSGGGAERSGGASMGSGGGASMGIPPPVVEAAPKVAPPMTADEEKNLVFKFLRLREDQLISLAQALEIDHGKIESAMQGQYSKGMIGQLIWENADKEVLRDYLNGEYGEFFMPEESPPAVRTPRQPPRDTPVGPLRDALAWAQANPGTSFALAVGAMAAAYYGVDPLA